MSVYDHRAVFRTSEEISMQAFEGKVMLIVNTASKCGFTPQFKGLEWLNRKYKDQGLCVVGFPCNQFANQDPANDDTIKGFCKKNYGVSFPVFARIDVNGEKAHPLYADLKNQARGVFWSKRIKWNFTKFLVDHNGKVLKRYAPVTKPSKLVGDIEKALANLDQ
ncbi:MAG: glutathione peroxidase [Cryomorphaceae bacterium]|jgi:glutathione peroxidase